MTRNSKRDKAVSIAVTVVAKNVESLRDEVFAHERTVTAKNIALAQAAHTTLSQVQRVTKQEVACGVDLLESLARALKVEPRDLLTPYFRKPPSHPPNRDQADAQLQRR